MEERERALFDSPWAAPRRRLRRTSTARDERVNGSAPVGGQQHSRSARVKPTSRIAGLDGLTHLGWTDKRGPPEPTLLVDAALFDASCAPETLAEIVDARLTHATSANDRNTLDDRAVQWENTLYADAVADLANGERGGDPCIMTA